MGTRNPDPEKARQVDAVVGTLSCSAKSNLKARKLSALAPATSIEG